MDDRIKEKDKLHKVHEIDTYNYNNNQQRIIQIT